MYALESIKYRCLQQLNEWAYNICIKKERPTPIVIQVALYLTRTLMMPSKLQFVAAIVISVHKYY